MKNILKGLTVSSVALLALVGGSSSVFAADDAATNDNQKVSTAEFTVKPGDGSEGGGEAGGLTLDKVPDLKFASTSVKDVATGNVELKLTSGTVTNDDTVTSKGKTAKNGDSDLKLQVSDYRGGTSGWNLTANLSDFKTTSGAGATLKAAELNLAYKDDGSDNPINASSAKLTPGVGSPVLSANETDGKTGLGLNKFEIVLPTESTDGTKVEGTTLSFDKTSTVKAGTYQADITWTLGNTFDASAAK